MKGFWNGAARALPFVLLAAVFLGAIFYPLPRESEGEQVRVVLIWNVDTFEGGKGSRASFLNRVARLAEQKSDGVYYRVVSYTAEGAQSAMAEGNYPDLLSFGIGLQVDREKCMPLGRAFGGSSLAVPWCRGEYLLFSMTDAFGERGDTAISVGGSNLSCAAAYFSEIEGAEKESLSAYLAFLGGEYRYLLGTQRDVNRFAARGTTVYSQPLPAYCDLYQYICMFSEDRGDCRPFLDALLSDDVQSSLSEIGMLPLDGAEGRTIDVFSTAQTLEEAARAVRAGSAEKNAEKYFKSI